MISIFEVFAINRDEDDFLENLGLFCENQNEGSSMQSVNSPNDTEDLSDPNQKVLFDFKEKLTKEEYEWCIEAVREGGKNILSTIDVFVKLKDEDDFIHSLKRCFKLDRK